MTKLEQLKAAFEAEPYGLSPADKDTMEPRLIRFYDAAHNLMPQLLEAVEVMLALGDAYDVGQPATKTSAIGRYRAVLEKLK